MLFVAAAETRTERQHACSARLGGRRRRWCGSARLRKDLKRHYTKYHQHDCNCSGRSMLHKTPVTARNRCLSPCATALSRTTLPRTRRRRDLATQGELFGQNCHAAGVDDGKRLELCEFFILDQFVPTIVEDQPALVVPDGENGMIGADSVVMDEHHAHVFGTHPSLPESHVFGEGVILTVAVTGFESTFFVNEGCGPLIGNAPLVSVGFIIDQGVDGRVDKCNFRKTFLSFGFPDDVFKSVFSLCTCRGSPGSSSILAVRPEYRP
jgi:hypothetical protein